MKIRRKKSRLLYWRERDSSRMPLKQTNWDACAALSGKADDQQWGGVRVRLTKTQVMFPRS